jgi:hypothetical protein
MTVRRASRGLQALRLGMGCVCLLCGIAFAVAGSWLLAALLVAGAFGAVTAFRKGVADPEAAKRAGREYAYPRLVGGVVGLVAVVCAAALGFLD